MRYVNFWIFCFMDIYFIKDFFETYYVQKWKLKVNK